MEQDFPVVIVGGGPTGIACSIYLAIAGVRSAIVERRTEINGHPRAHYVNTRTTELFHQLGIYQDLLPEALPGEYMSYNLLEMMGGLSFPDRLKLSPAIVQSVAQDIVEAVMERKRATFGDLITMMRGVACDQIENGDDGVTVHLSREDGSQFRLTARYLVAADGAHSPIRNQLGIAMIGDPELDRVMNIYFHGDIVKPGNFPSLGGMSEDEVIKGAFINMDGKTRYCFQYLVEPGDEPEHFTPERCEEIVRRASRMPAERPVEIKSVKPWTMSALVAERFRDRSVFLVGDAAHAFPPSGGMGLNSGVHDAHNLAWKLALALAGKAGPALLDSYETERQPVAFLNTAQSFRNAASMNLRGDAKPFNVSLETMAMIDARATKTVVSVAATLPPGDERDFMDLMEHGGAMGQELGFSYIGSPVIVDDGAERPLITVADYIPNACPGARAPHMWLEKDGQKLSTIDLFLDRFVLLVGTDGHGWRKAVADAVLPFAVRVIAIGVGQDFEPADDADFAELYGVADNGAVLVRPDGHVAFRSASLPADATSALEHAAAIAAGLGSDPAAVCLSSRSEQPA